MRPSRRKSLPKACTLRKALGVPGERTYHVPSLSVPTLDGMRPLTVDEALQYDAVALFTVRAEAADSRVALTQQLVPTVVKICRRPDGIALAIELAAACVKELSASRLAQKLNECFLILTRGTRTALPRLGYKRQYTEQQEYDKMLPVLGDELGADLDALMNDG
jgi:predicted ATPase